MEVDEDGGGQRDRRLGLLDLQLAGARTGLPVDRTHWIAGLVVADPIDAGRIRKNGLAAGNGAIGCV